MTEDETKAYRIAVNKTAEEATWDYDALIVEVQELAEENYNINNLGFANDILTDLLNNKKDGEIQDGETPPDFIPDIDIDKISSKKNTVYQLGNHRLLVGECTVENMEKLLKNERVKILLSSYKNSNSEELDRIKKAVYYLQSSGSFYLIGDELISLRMDSICRQADLEVMENLIVRKNIFHRQRFYPSSNSVILYGGKMNCEVEWYSDRKQDNYFEYNLTDKGDIPVSLRILFLRNSSQIEDSVLDVNAGNGDTVIACEQAGRICYAVTSDCVEAEIIRKRWAEFVYGAGCNYLEKTMEVK
jgi:hypothetical protein